MFPPVAIAYLLIGLFVMAVVEAAFKDDEPQWWIVFVWPFFLAAFLLVGTLMAIYWLGMKFGEFISRLGGK